MRSITTLILVTALVTMSAPAWGNGGPIEETALYRTGNIVQETCPDITLDKEYLSIELDGNFADVTVEYHLTNHGKARLVTYAFPVDELVYDMIAATKEEELTGLSFDDETGILPITATTETSSIEVMTEGGYPMYLSRTWYATEIFFQGATSKTLTVQYRVKAYLNDIVVSKSFFPSISLRELHYTFAPAASWGNGTLDLLKIDLDSSKLPAAARSPKSSSLGFTATKPGHYVYEATDVVLASMKDLHLAWDNEVASFDAYMEEHRVGGAMLEGVEASSTLATATSKESGYGALNLVDGDLSTAWVEGSSGLGVGEWIEVEVSGFSVIAVALVNGFTKSKQTYLANARVKKAKVDIIDAAGEEITLHSVIKDLPDRPFEELDPAHPGTFATVLMDLGDTYWEPAKVKVTILEVYPGTKHDDLAMSELYILGVPFE